MNGITIVSRRGFLEGVVSAGALILGAPLLKAGEADNASFHPSVYLGIQPDGTVIIVCHRSEMGTGMRSVLPVVAAAELEAEWQLVKVQQAMAVAKSGSE